LDGRPGTSNKITCSGCANSSAEVEKLRAHKDEILALLKREAETERISALDAERNAADRAAHRGYDYDTTAPRHGEFRTPAQSLIRTCVEYGVGLRLEADGTLVVASNGRAWRSLVNAIEHHADAVARLLQEGWFPYDA
jgi:hypothetical protein